MKDMASLTMVLDHMTTGDDEIFRIADDFRQSYTELMIEGVKLGTP